jgi:quinolinate synthase
MHRYASAGFTLHPQIRAAGKVTPSRLRTPELPVREATPADFALAGDRRGYAHVRSGRVHAVAATDDATASALLWRCLAHAGDLDTEATVEHVSAEQQWAVRAIVEAGLSMAPSGPVFWRGRKPPSTVPPVRPVPLRKPFVPCRVGIVVTTDLGLGVEPTPLALLLLGRQSDADSERGTSCPGDLPAPSDPKLVERARAAKVALGEKVFVLGHHYQRDEVIQFADVTGDSFKLAREAAARPGSSYVVFCGVHFMAESADILTGPEQQVVLPDLAAGCSMADMASAEQVAEAWDVLTDAGVADVTVPVSYMNSSAAIKAFTGRHGGTICTSSNAEVALRWALDPARSAEGSKVLFLPDQHLGRNTAVTKLGLSLDDCVVYDPRKPDGGLTREQLQAATVILWKGHCSVHGRFTVECVDAVRERVPGVTVLVHPECTHEVVSAADLVGSTEFIIKTIEAAPPGSAWAIGTELNLVSRLAKAHPDKRIVFLDKTVCFCSTMNRIDLPHLVWALESLVDGHVVNRIEVDPDTAKWAKAALDQMLALPAA